MNRLRIAVLVLCTFGALVLVSPAAVAAATRPHVAALNIRKVDGTTWGGISATSCLGGVSYAYTGTDHHLNIAADQDITQSTYVFSDTSQDGPSITCWENNIWLAWTANNNSHNILVGEYDINKCTSDPGISHYHCTLVNVTTLPNNQATMYTPAIIGNGSTLYVTYRWTTNNNMTVNESVTGLSWFKQTTIQGDTSSTEPSLTTYHGQTILGWAGTDMPSHVNFATYSDGNPRLSNHIVASDTTYGAPNFHMGISVWNDRIQLAFIASDTSYLIYTGSWSQRTGYVRNGSLAGTNATAGIGLIGVNVYYPDPRDAPYTIHELQMPG